MGNNYENIYQSQIDEETLKDNSKLLLCPECDEIYLFEMINKRQRAKCHRCGEILYNGDSTITMVKVLTISGLLLFYPAIFLPVLKIKMAGANLETSTYESIFAFTTKAYWPIAISVVLFAILIPLFRLVAYLTVVFKNQFINHHLGRTFIRFLRASHEWSMIDVYFMGIIVTVAKMVDRSEVELTIGTLSLILLMVNNILLQSVTHYDELWKKLYERN
ncbi:MULTISPECIES: paraquat-inducible protein A [Halobacteriovorax]|uniref:Paraquat-inducible protein A n=1 Tax=Halobacteriovorax vibrionivorans TaxID=2152716 RepID=A0ABY0ICZ9_9BACT|nr:MULTISPECIES: paraquat-inducible protein A [Halobacteriovorax]RZF20833.1 paraquat-inducible protein A [Halobacteriovorax vibrionivorans]TGD48217.1 paraquat-inducible protein A [Halobacteriovorax sp. Y22]